MRGCLIRSARPDRRKGGGFSFVYTLIADAVASTEFIAIGSSATVVKGFRYDRHSRGGLLNQHCHGAVVAAAVLIWLRRTSPRAPHEVLVGMAVIALCGMGRSSPRHC